MILQQGLFFVGGAGRNFRLMGGAGRVGKPDKALERKEFVAPTVLQPNLIEGHLKCLLPLFLVRTGNDGRCRIKK